MTRLSRYRLYNAASNTPPPRDLSPVAGEDVPPFPDASPPSTGDDVAATADVDPENAASLRSGD